MVTFVVALLTFVVLLILSCACHPSAQPVGTAQYVAVDVRHHCSVTMLSADSFDVGSAVVWYECLNAMIH